ncbi:unnamed protein product, partial [Ectocarpus fasciculatus]
MCKSRTGSGKTLAFAIPIIEALDRQSGGESVQRQRGGRGRLFSRGAYGRLPRAICVAPTRELAKQVEREFNRIAPELSSLAVYGGTAQGPQIGEMRRGVDIIVGTPGRIIDHIQQGNLNLSQIQFCVLDEADLMLQMGFQEPVEEIFKEMPEDKQTTLWSATMPRLTQAAREACLGRFRSGRTKMIVATDVAARGLDIPGVDMVFHYRLPNEKESFVHRSGRTGRAGKAGLNIMLCSNVEDRQLAALEGDYSFKSLRRSPPSGASSVEEMAGEIKQKILSVSAASVRMYEPQAADLLKKLGLSVAEDVSAEGTGGVAANRIVPLEGVQALSAAMSLVGGDSGLSAE